MASLRKGEQLSLKDIKSISLEGLCYFADFCKRNELTYYLAYGTLLGAVRHNGYIPWDDDIDIWMPRKDYDRLIAMYDRFDDSGVWQLLHSSTNHKYMWPWLKVANTETLVYPSRFITGMLYGMSIDIFPLEMAHSKVTTKEGALLDMQNLTAYYEGILNSYGYQTGGVKLSIYQKCRRLPRLLIKTIKHGHFFAVCEQYDEACRKQSCKSDSALYLFCCQTPMKRIFLKKWFETTIDVTFEGMTFKAPNDFHSILAECYGDYMTLPPIGERKTHHNFTLYSLK